MTGYRIDRRVFLAYWGALVLSGRPVTAAEPPEDLVRALYAAQSASLATGGKPLVAMPERWHEFLTPALVILWRKINSRSRAGQPHPVTIDPFTGGASSQISLLTLSREQQDQDSATVLARFLRADGEGQVAYTLVMTGAGWRIDDVVAIAQSRRWSLRRALSGQPQRR